MRQAVRAPESCGAWRAMDFHKDDERVITTVWRLCKRHVCQHTLSLSRARRSTNAPTEQSIFTFGFESGQDCLLNRNLSPAIDRCLNTAKTKDYHCLRNCLRISWTSELWHIFFKRAEKQLELLMIVKHVFLRGLASRVTKSIMTRLHIFTMLTSSNLNRQVLRP